MTIKNKVSVLNIIAIISAIGMIGWIITDFFGGMIIWMLSYGLIILPILLLYIISFFDTLISLIRNGKKTSKTKLITHGLVFLTIIIFNLYHSELFKSQKIMTAILKDDLYHYRLIFRENGNVENQANGVFGFSQTYNGKYKIENNLIIFSQKPYDNEFLPDTLLLDKKQGAIFLNKNNSGDFNTEKEWLNHFKIE
ncbi:MAG: hypothetical protein IZT56_14450 [Bacteroidetes bacterium]|nr:hypothetical protein [Bacteroidota bacterium]